MGAITNKCFELIESAGHYEERRSVGHLIKCNFFDAVDATGGNNGTIAKPAQSGEGGEGKDSRTIQARRHSAINDIP
jgi:hypothetical protein